MSLSTEGKRNSSLNDAQIKSLKGEITAAIVREHLSEFSLLDVRTYLEREQFSIGGLHIPLDELSMRINEIPVDKRLVVYCKIGIRSLAAIDILKSVGYPSDLLNLKNGIQDF